MPSAGDQTIERDAARVIEEYGRRGRDPSLARYYARIGTALGRAVAERRHTVLKLLTTVGTLSTLRVLDIGCGDGGDLAFFAEHGFEPRLIAGVDLLPEALALAREHLPEATFQEGNAARLPFDDGGFDVVLQTTVLSSIIDPDVRKAVALEAARVLRPGGLIVSYDMRSDTSGNEHLVAIDRRELERLFGEIGQMELSPLTLSLRIASRVPRQVGALLDRLPMLRSHYLVAVRKS
jgi:ubiquinone/menaquinone biosynthesis C-methylase UbiE